MNAEKIRAAVEKAAKTKQKMAMFYFQVLIHADEIRKEDDLVQFSKEILPDHSKPSTGIKQMLRLDEVIKEQGYVLKKA